MAFLQFVSQHSLLIAIAVIIIFLLWQFYLKPKLGKKNSSISKEPQQSNAEVIQKTDSSVKQADTTPSRIGRGFGVMMDKLKNSDYVKGMQEERESAKVTDMMPRELMGNQEESEDVWSTDFSKLKKVDI
jgi:hypothetical protein